MIASFSAAALPTRRLTLDQLWNAPAPTPRPFDPDRLRHLPAPARRYLTHAIAPGTPLATAVRLRLRGQIKLQSWRPFAAEQVLRWGRGFVFAARVRLGLLPVRGQDRYLDGDGEMDWRLCSLLRLVHGSGADIARSAAGRFAAEAWLLPSALCGDGVQWSAPSDSRATASFDVHGRRHDLDFAIDPQGQLLACRTRRWGNPGGGAFAEHDFGGSFALDRAFGGYTLPTSMSAGWHFGSAGFADGEFYRATIERAEFR